MIRNTVDSPESGWQRVEDGADYQLNERGGPHADRGVDGDHGRELRDRVLAATHRLMEERSLDFTAALARARADRTLMEGLTRDAERGAKRRRPARELLDSLVRQRMTQEGLNYTEALKAVAEDHMDLWTEGLEEIR